MPEGPKVSRRRGKVRGVPSHLTRGSGEPSGVRGGAPAEKKIFGAF